MSLSPNDRAAANVCDDRAIFTPATAFDDDASWADINDLRASQAKIAGLFLGQPRCAATAAFAAIPAWTAAVATPVAFVTAALVVADLDINDTV